MEDSVKNFAPESPRIKIHKVNSDLEITIPSRFSFTVIFLGVWLCAWTVGGVTALSQIFNPITPVSGRVFLGFWALGWFLGVCATIWSIGWMLAGCERLSIQKGILTHWIGIGVVGQTRRFEVKNLVDLRLSIYTRRRRNPGQCIAWDYGMRTYEVAKDADDAERQAVLTALKESLVNSQVQ